MKPCWIFDLDGTLANGDHRVHHILKTPRDWDSFYAECGADAPIRHNIEILLSVGERHEVFIVTGRGAQVRAQTMAWLAQHIFPFTEEDVYMRAVGDHRDDAVIKIEALEAIRARGYEPLAAFEDRDRSVAAWRAAGIPCLQVTDKGNF